MKARTTSLFHNVKAIVLGAALLGAVVATQPAAIAGAPPAEDAEHSHRDHENAAPARLVELVRDATRQFIDVNAAVAAGYNPFLGCVSGPDHGAMGIHYVNLALVGDGEIDAPKTGGVDLRAVGWRPAAGRGHLAGASLDSTRP